MMLIKVFHWKHWFHIFDNQKCGTMHPKLTQYNLRKKYQTAFRRWLTEHAPGSTITPYVGGDLSFVREWISNRLLPGMNWSNYGQVWVIDHIVPVRLFDFMKHEDLAIALHYKNLMPLFKEDNLYKEGAIDFSIRILNEIPTCQVVYKLLKVLEKERMRLDKYLPTVALLENEMFKANSVL